MKNIQTNVLHRIKYGVGIFKKSPSTLSLIKQYRQSVIFKHEIVSTYVNDFLPFPLKK